MVKVVKLVQLVLRMLNKLLAHNLPPYSALLNCSFLCSGSRPCEASYDMAGAVINISCIVFSPFCKSRGVHERPEVCTLTYQCIQGIYNPQLHGMSTFRWCCATYGSYVIVDHFNSGACYAQRSEGNLAKIKKEENVSLD